MQKIQINLMDSIFQAIKNVGNAIAASRFARLLGNIIDGFGGGRAAEARHGAR
jgi:hypothetical protein